MQLKRYLALLLLSSLNPIFGQVLVHRPQPQPFGESQLPTSPVPLVMPSMPLIVPAGTPIKVGLEKELPIEKVGQPIKGKVVEPVYAFDKLVIPAGSEVSGSISELDDTSKTSRTIRAMNGDFSPHRQVHIVFDSLHLPDGRTVALKTTVSAASQGVLQFVPAGTAPQSKMEEAHSAAARQVKEARKEIKTRWETVKAQISAPEKMHRLEHLAVAQLPYHHQYIQAGTTFNADLQEPLNFGSEATTAETLSHIGTTPPPGSNVHALLVTPLSSATTKKGDPVEAVISQPLFVSDNLVLPEGSRLKGSVLQVRPASRLARNGQLRIMFHQVVPPDGVEQALQASLEGVEVSKGEHLTLDQEGGAQVVTPKTRYLTTGIAVALAASSVSPEHDRDHDLHDGGGDMGGGAANGASGFHLAGMLVGAFAQSRAVASGFGIYGAGMSVYSHFLAKGHDVVYPKDMAMVVGLGSRATQSQKPKN